MTPTSDAETYTGKKLRRKVMEATACAVSQEVERGRSSNSSLRIAQDGLKVTKLAFASLLAPLPLSSFDDMLSVM